MLEATTMRFNACAETSYQRYRDPFDSLEFFLNLYSIFHRFVSVISSRVECTIYFKYSYEEKFNRGTSFIRGKNYYKNPYTSWKLKWRYVRTNFSIVFECWTLSVILFTYYEKVFEEEKRKKWSNIFYIGSTTLLCFVMSNTYPSIILSRWYNCRMLDASVLSPRIRTKPCKDSL